MNSVKRQYFFIFHLMGCVFPFIAVYLREQSGFSEAEIGYTMAVGFGTVMLSPVIVTFLADWQIDSRKILAALYLLSGFVFLVFGIFQYVWILIVLWGLHSLSFSAQVPLQDGFYFSVTRKLKEEGRTSAPYHRIRIWGTVGFILPSIYIFFLIRSGSSISIILPLAVASAVLGMINAFTMVDTRRPDLRREGKEKGLPTVEAARVLFQPGVLPWAIGMALGIMGGATFYAFYPVYLSEVVGIPAEWLGLIFNIGVVFEFFFMLAFGWLLRKLGIRLLIGLGLALASLRMGLLALFPTVEVAILTQIVHGPYILAIHVAPPLLLNRLAGDAFRNSMQGLYNMTLQGVSRIIGSLLAGYLAAFSLELSFYVGAILILLGALVMVVFFRSPVASFREE